MSKIELPIKPEAFWELFSKNLEEKINKTRDFEKIYTSNKIELTKFMTNLVSELGSKNLGMIVEKEYLQRFDVSFFDKSAAWEEEWSYEAVIEIENQDNWLSELCKMILLPCGLKVLISYYDNFDKTIKQLNEFKKIYNSRKYHQISENWLLIFGPYAGKNDEFKALKFDGKEIIEITNNNKIIIK